MQSLLRQIAWFVIVGCAAAATHWIVVVALVKYAGLRPPIANIGGWLVAFVVSFSGHFHLTFRHVGAAWLHAAWRFLLVSVLGFAKLETGDAWLLDDPHQRRPLEQFAGEKVVAAAGIGSPERFFATLRAAGLAPATRALPDHYAFERNPFADAHADAILITEKDTVKLGSWRDARIWVVPVEAALDPRLIALVVEKLRGRTSA